MEGFPGVLLVVKNPPTNAGDTGLMFGGNITLAEGQPSTLATLLKPTCQEPAHCSDTEPLLAAVRESFHAAAKTQHSQK